MKARELANYLLKLEKTTSRLEITRILAEIFEKAEAEEIDKLCYLILGELAPAHRGIEFNLAEKMMIRVLAQAFGVEKETVEKSSGQKGDLGLVAEELAQKKGGKKEASSLTVEELYAKLLEIAQDAGEGSQERKIRKMAALLKLLSPLEARFFVRIPLGRLRLGFSETTLLDAFSWLLSGDKCWREKIEAAYNRRADIGFIAKTIKQKGIEGLEEIKIVLGTPVLPSLCQRLPTAEEMIKKTAPQEGDLVAVEPKYDGTRLEVQFRRDGQPQVWMFTRNLENVAAMFPDIAEAIPKEINAQAAILDGEVIGVDKKTGRLLPFQETIKRKRKHEIQATLLKIPLRYYCFDILYYNGEETIHLPFSQRRQILEKMIKPNTKIVFLSPQILTNDVKKLRRYHEEQIKKGLEGVVVKKWQAPYEPGKRGFTWVKFKQEESKKSGGLLDTVEGVVMGYYLGRGKRAGFGIGAFLVGVRNGEKIVTVSKIGTGLSDEDWREMRRRAQEAKTDTKPKEYTVPKELVPDVWCLPKVVVEIAADNLTHSPLHTAGFALRFPRLVRFRDDKSVEEITTLEELKKLG